MLKNYIIIAWKVLGRRKFFTFVSLFGISITLMILIVLSAFYDTSFGPYGPEKKLGRILFVPTATFTKMNGGGSMRGSTSNYFLSKTVKTLKTPEKVSIVKMFTPTDCYLGDKKLSFFTKFTDANYWDILDFDFIHGRPFNQKDIELANKVAVISEKTAEEYFGNSSCIGQKIDIENTDFVVIGVVENVTITKIFSFSNIYLPISVSGDDLSVPRLSGFSMAMMLAHNKDDFEAIRAEYKKSLANFQFPNPDRYDHVESAAGPFLKSAIETAAGDNGNTIYLMLKIVVVVLLLLFMAFPTINLVNLNVTRIIERASEIGIRKSFGASIRTLMWQFIIENIIITFLGGIIGFVLSIIVIFIINSSGVIPNFILSINFMLFVYSLGITLFFGLFSGVYPAWRMSKLQIMHALNIDK